jgi:hypothetical protein
MPKQEMILKDSAGRVTVEVIKTYDRDYAREVFNGMEQDAMEALAQALEPAKQYEPADIPNPDEIEYKSFLWEQLSDESLEDVRQSPSEEIEKCRQ